MEIKRKRVSAVIIQDKKILLVRGNSGFYKDFYFTPGGRVEDGESDLETLKRELMEELSIELLNFSKYIEYQAPLQNDGGMQQIDCYLITIDIEKIKLASEIGEMRWFLRADFENKDLVVSESTKKFLVPKLIEDGLI
ncbi:NUDIX domain-containing protein [Candidatus Shapirobacteria bacterium]|nr:NUDIX domain-containing protein [Candidatus Shapirobacteria bacterium]